MNYIHQKEYSLIDDRDAHSKHVSDADEAISLGSIERPASGRNPFLDIDLLVRTALAAGAHAVHPGYGYLSENAQFADRVRQAGLVFIGPSSKAMLTLGDKRRSKEYLRAHAPEVPLIPGFAGSSQEAEDLEKAAAEIGFPVMLKASAGGGGKGMRIIREASQLRDELKRAQSEAQRSFGSSDCILEKYIENSKHVEIQILGDSHGEVVSLFDRDCSVQRRHQKVIEETPCPFLDAETRKRMSEVAVTIAKLIGYEGAGTVEFVFDVSTNKFYFLEVNARLQVEHPVTEEVTGLDLVSLQLYVAAGGRLRDLPAIQSLCQTGHAIECRLCAEDPQKDFFPDHGRVHLWLPGSRTHGPGTDVRYETAIRTGSSVSIYFDSMIAKIVVWAPTRALAIEKLVDELRATACLGVKTNQLFLQSCLLHPAFHDPAYTTSFIPRNLDSLLKNPHRARLPPDHEKVLSIIPCLYLRRLAEVSSNDRRRPFQHVRRQFRNQRFDPVSVHCDVVTAVDRTKTKAPAAEGKQEQDQPMMCLWKNASEGASNDNVRELHLLPVPPVDSTTRRDKDKDSSKKDTKEISEATALYNTISRALRSGEATSTPPYRVSIDSWHQHENHPGTSTIQVSINGSKILAHIAIVDNNQTQTQSQLQTVICHFPHLGTSLTYTRFATLLSYCASIRTSPSQNANSALTSRTVRAPMPCKVLSVLKRDGEAVKPGETVMVIESMKMEVAITVSEAGRFKTKWKVGDAVDEGSVLCEVE